jgi:hypothetical protein
MISLAARKEHRIAHLLKVLPLAYQCPNSPLWICNSTRRPKALLITT